MEHVIESTTEGSGPDLSSSVSSSPIAFTPSVISNITSTSTSAYFSFCCNNTSEIYSTLHLNNTNGTQNVEATIIDDQEKFQMTKDGFDDYLEEHFPTPISILLLNFFLVIFLMIVIGIAMYPAVKKYCDSSTFPYGNHNGNEGNNSYWIEDTEEVSSSSVALNTSPFNEASVALLNSPNGAEISSCADFNSACDIELLSER